jgi:hypothetical protein
MPFPRNENKVRTYTALSYLKSCYKKVIQNVNSTPAQILEATNKLEYLCADSPEERKVQQLKMIAQYGAKVGLRIVEPVPFTGDPIADAQKATVDRLYEWINAKGGDNGSIQS